jgi:long-chain acyl-CoA synthetase
MENLISNGMRSLDVKKEEPKPDSILILATTSGTTGEPKQAMLTHRNFISGMVSQEALGFGFNKNDVYLSYVPLTHVYEQIMFVNCIMFGFKVGFGSG